MSLYPDVQKKARAELDAVVGSTRLPDLRDRPNLPYINAIVKETLRWHTVVPLSLPHVSTADDEYDGFFIPKGSIVMVNAWSVSHFVVVIQNADSLMARSRSILHDPERYPQPEKFVPDRFVKNGALNMDPGDPAHIAFGFGRRSVVLDHSTQRRAIAQTIMNRICPGRYFAEAALFIYIASVLHTLDISPPLDEDARPFRIEPQPISELVT